MIARDPVRTARRAAAPALAGRDRVDRFGQLGACLAPLVAILGPAPLDASDQTRVVRLFDRGRWLRDVLGRERLEAVAFERQTTREHRVRKHAERVDIAASVY